MWATADVAMPFDAVIVRRWALTAVFWKYAEKERVVGTPSYLSAFRLKERLKIWLLQLLSMMLPLEILKLAENHFLLFRQRRIIEQRFILLV
jgi:hypothetical protein